ncbi:MAG: TlpA family protein disulfide reductase [Candidatus Eremiobacteraeota bacterium]|nr:TlpA family protein disulfide reductase [Candidatus Eremiobacteraeota bacterium]
MRGDAKAAPAGSPAAARAPLKTAVGLAVAAILFALAFGIMRHAMRPPSTGMATTQSGRAKVGQRSPDFALTRLDGSRTALDAYQGHPLFVNFFATWCRPCKAELPDIEQRYRAGRSKGLVVLGIDQQESPALVKAFAAPRGLTFPLAIDEGQGALRYQLRAIPTSVFIDASGIVRAIHIGQISPQDMDADLSEIL